MNNCFKIYYSIIKFISITVPSKTTIPDNYVEIFIKKTYYDIDSSINRFTDASLLDCTNKCDQHTRSCRTILYDENKKICVIGIKTSTFSTDISSDIWKVYEKHCKRCY